jgi:hypothetical protein
LSVGGSVRYLVRKPRCTVTIDWVLANCRTQRAFCSPENAMFAHHCLLAEKRVTTPSHLSRKNFYISSIRWHSYMWVCYCTAKPLNPGWTYETRCTSCNGVGKLYIDLLASDLCFICLSIKLSKISFTCVFYFYLVLLTATNVYGARHSVVGVATRYRLYGPEIELRLGRIFRAHPDRPRGSPKPPVQWVPGLYGGRTTGALC